MSAARYNYKHEGLYAALIACVFIGSVAFGGAEKFQAIAVKVLSPKEKKKNEEDLTPAEAELLERATPTLTNWDRLTMSIRQKKIILWRAHQNGLDTLQFQKTYHYGTTHSGTASRTGRLAGGTAATHHQNKTPQKENNKKKRPGARPHHQRHCEKGYVLTP